MSEILPSGHAATVAAYRGTNVPLDSELEVWIQRFQALDEDAVYHLSPVLDAGDAVETMQTAMAMIPHLMNPGEYLAAMLAQPRDEFMVAAFQLHQVTEFLKNPGGSAKEMETWCQEKLDSAATADPDRASDISEWCFGMLAKHDPGVSRWFTELLRSSSAKKAEQRTQPQPPQPRWNHMIQFVARTINLLAEIPGTFSPDNEDWPMRTLDLEGVERFYQGMPPEQREELAKHWGAVQALVDEQNKLHHAANQIIDTLTHWIARAMPFDEDMDTLLRESTAQRQLTELLDEMPAEHRRILLSMARRLRGDGKRSHAEPTQPTKGRQAMLQSKARQPRSGKKTTKPKSATALTPKRNVKAHRRPSRSR